MIPDFQSCTSGAAPSHRHPQNSRLVYVGQTRPVRHPAQRAHPSESLAPCRAPARTAAAWPTLRARPRASTKQRATPEPTARAGCAKWETAGSVLNKSDVCGTTSRRHPCGGARSVMYQLPWERPFISAAAAASTTLSRRGGTRCGFCKAQPQLGIIKRDPKRPRCVARCC